MTRAAMRPRRWSWRDCAKRPSRWPPVLGRTARRGTEHPRFRASRPGQACRASLSLAPLVWIKAWIVPEARRCSWRARHPTCATAAIWHRAQDLDVPSSLFPGWARLVKRHRTVTMIGAGRVATLLFWRTSVMLEARASVARKLGAACVPMWPIGADLHADHRASDDLYQAGYNTAHLIASE